MPARVAPELDGDEQAVRSGASRAASASLIVPPTPGSAPPDRFRAVAYEFKLPDLGEGLTEGEVARWLVRGGRGRRGPAARRDPDGQDDRRDPLPRPGRSPASSSRRARSSRSARSSSSSAKGATTARGPFSQTATGRSRHGQGTGAGDVRATPLVRRLAVRSSASSPESVPGTGPQGRVTEADVRAAAPSGDATPGPGSEGRRGRRGGPQADRRAHDPRAPRSARRRRGSRRRDFGGVDLASSCRRCSRPARSALKEFPELNARLEGRTSSTSSATTSAWPSRPKRASSCPSSEAATRPRSTSSPRRSIGSRTAPAR